MKNGGGLWGGFLWTTLWYVFFIWLAFQSIMELVDGTAVLEAFAILVLSVALMLFGLKAYIGKIKALRGFYAKEDALPPKQEQEHLENCLSQQYRRRCWKKIVLFVLYPIITYGLLGMTLFLMGVWGSFGALVQSPAFFILFGGIALLVLKTLSEMNRNLCLIDEVYAGSTTDDFARLNQAFGENGKGFPGFAFTSRYLLNWDGKLIILPLSEIKSVSYRSYCYLIISGVSLMIHMKSGKKHRVWHYGPSGEDWENNLPGIFIPNGKQTQQISMNLSLPG